MAEERMSLEEAAALLGGLHPNTVRARAKKGKYRFETDNSGKWWVFIDPAKAANDSKAKPPKPLTMEAPLKATIESDFKALELTIQTISEELQAVRAERDTLRREVADSATLKTALAASEARAAGLEREAADLRRRLDDGDTERRWLTETLAGMARPAPPVARERPRRSWWGWGRAKD